MNHVERDAQHMAQSKAGAVAPDTAGWNFFAADSGLQDILALYLAEDLYAHLVPHLSRLGELCAGRLDRAAHLADRHPPVLHHRDRFGNDEQWIEYHPAYRELEHAAFGEFGIHALSHRGGILGWPEPLPVVAKHAFTYLFNQTEFGLGCPINVTDSGAHCLRLFGDDAVKERFLDRMLSTDVDELWQGAQFMTEKEGGSDVGSATTRAMFDGEHWRIYGDKWFCSNADGKAVLLLARPEGAPDGTRGLGMFVMPRFLDDGSPNAYRIIRLKDKLGTRSMASGEVKLEGAIAYPLGELENGMKQMLEMVNWSRLSNGVKSAALMRRAVHDATAAMRGRRVFGTLLSEKPLAKRQMLKIALPAEQSLSLSFYTADALDKAEGYGGQAASQTARAILRLATPVLKLRATRDGRKVTGDAMEMRGGIGYVEEWINPRLVRDAHLGSIWEGSSNVVAIDAVVRAVGKHACQEPFVADLDAKLAEAPDLPQSYRNQLREMLNRAGAELAAVAADSTGEAAMRQVTTLFYHTTTAVLLAWEGAMIHAARGDARRLLWSKLVVDHHLSPSDPFAIPRDEAENSVADLLLSDAPVSMSAVERLL